MAWKDDVRNYEPGPGAATEPGQRGVRSGEPPMDEVRSVRREGAPSPRGYVRSEMPVVTDGQLGDTIDRGPEPANPEGSVDIPNGDYHGIEEQASARRGDRFERGL